MGIPSDPQERRLRHPPRLQPRPPRPRQSRLSWGKPTKQ